MDPTAEDGSKIKATSTKVKMQTAVIVATPKHTIMDSIFGGDEESSTRGGKSTGFWGNDETTTAPKETSTGFKWGSEETRRA
jgi:hypothetical protein